MSKSQEQAEYPSKLIALGICAAALLLVIALPISNLFIKRPLLASSEDPQFKVVSDLLTRKCADCHSSDLSEYPLYHSFPLAREIIARNIENGRRSFLLNQDKLSGKVKFSADDLSRLSQALAKGNMPPLQYILLHWDSALNAKEERLLVNWIKKRSGEYDIKAIPNENPFHPDPAKAQLGKLLFNDKRLSADASVSCASCHRLDEGGSQHTRYATGVKGRIASCNTPSVYNAAYNLSQYWDGRSRDLKAQAYAAISNPDEMNSSWELVQARLESDEALMREFKRCYAQGFNADTASDAIAEYEHSLITQGSRFDKYLNGDKNALSLEEKEGFELFKKHDCISCHAGPALGGLSYELSPVSNYTGRFNVTHISSDRGKVKVPGLRNVELTYPYFHDGSAASLQEAVKIMAETKAGNALSSTEEEKLLSFLKTLTAPRVSGKR